MVEPTGVTTASDSHPIRFTRRQALRIGAIGLGVGAVMASALNGATIAGAQSAPSYPSVPINGKLTIVQAKDFYQGHNDFIQAQINQFAQQQGYPLDLSYIDAYAGAGDVVQKLTAAVQSDNGPDLLIHTLLPSQLHFLDIIDDVDALEIDLQTFHGPAAPAYKAILNLEGKWWAVPHFSRSGGFWVRKSAFDAIGVDPFTQLTDYNALRDNALKISHPDQSQWGWGMTANRSGDGDTTVREPVFQWGAQVVDQTGQVVVLNKEPNRQYAIDALTWLQDIYTSPQWANMLPPGVGGWTDPSNNEALLAGKILMTNNAGTVYAQSIKDQNPIRDDTYLLYQPNGVGTGARVLTGAGGPMNFFIMKGAKNRDAAEQVIRFLMTPETYKQMFQISTAYVYPAHAWGWDQPEITENPYAQHVTDVYRKSFDDPSGWWGNLAWPGPPTPQADALENSNFWTDMFGEILGGKTPADAVADAHDRAVQTFKQFGAQGE
jgi:multiple sugar transport system substrate-binding protein